MNDNDLKKNIDNDNVNMNDTLDTTNNENMQNLDTENLNDVKKSIDNAEEQLNAAKQDLLRAYAEIENIRKRTQQDINKAHKFALTDFVKALLPIVDSLEKSLESHEDESHESMQKGITLTLKMFLDTLTKFGVKAVDPLNHPFNPDLHEAISMQKNEDLEANTVMAVLQKGYQLHERLLRPALVIVSQ